MASTNNQPSPKGSASFRPARPSPWLLKLAQTLIKLDLDRNNKLHIDEKELEILRRLPEGTGLVITPNHADEMDPRLCLDLSRRSMKRFLLMCNREAFNEIYGLAGIGLQGIGYFSVERGGHDTAAKRYAIDVVSGGRDALVIFPEGEIFYLNESLQPFHSGAIDIGMQAIIERRKSDPVWTSYILPISIKYRYAEPIKNILQKRVEKMERTLHQDRSGHELSKRLRLLQAKLLAQEEAAYHISPDADRLAKLTVRIEHARRTILEQVEEKNTSSYNSQARTIDQAWQVGAHLREKLEGNLSPDEEKEIKAELAALTEVEQLVSWQPQYVETKPSEDRMAEMVLKLERELYRIKRPKQLARRNVYLRIAEPIDLSQYLDEYLVNPHAVRHKMAEQLRDTIQDLINRDS
ncbi:MAG: 1-acyl-sn-glycerol-3-phosphate acyltransferase [Cyanobacteria bacterium SZAS LIN-3]|nr:1-acyl-sn-glycerol-3-phosphate acyltransferase [Cyanobacteria bacterium SZAS LIN-3]